MKEKIKNGVKELGRAFGFFYPDEIVELKRDGKTYKTLEDPRINHPEDDQLPIIEGKIKDKSDLNQLDEKIEEPDNEDEDAETDDEDDSKLEVGGDYSIITDREDDEMFLVEGDVRSVQRPVSINQMFGKAILAIIIPFVIGYQLFINYLIGLHGWNVYLTMITIFLFAMALFQGNHVKNKTIQTVRTAYRGQISDLEYYIPLREKYLSGKAKDDQNLISDTVQILISHFRPILSENRHMTHEINNIEDRMARAVKMGERKVLTQLVDEGRSKWLYILIGLIVGVIITWILMGGLSPAPPESPGNETAAQIISMMRW